MSVSRILVTDRTGLVGAGGSLLAGLPPAVAAGYLLLRLLIPVLLFVLASRGATPAQRISLVRDYLLGSPTPLGPEPTPPGAASSALPAPELPTPAAGDSDDRAR